jgi:hypothetical protein
MPGGEGVAQVVPAEILDLSQSEALPLSLGGDIGYRVP